MIRTLAYDLALAAVSLAVAVTRACGVTNDVFKDFAHMLVAGMFVGWLFSRPDHGGPRTRPALLWLPVGLTAVETAAFLYFRVLK